MRPPCSRRRNPSAKKKKSNLAASAVCARWTKDEKSIWLPASGSLQTVVLFTPGKWAPRMTCLANGSLPGVAVDRRGQAEALAQRAAARMEQIEIPEPGYDLAGDESDVAPEPEAVGERPGGDE